MSGPLNSCQASQHRQSPPLLIGSLRPDSRCFLAPMAGVTDSAFRTIARSFGCGMTTTEMISSKALVYNNAHTRDMLAFTPEERPLAIQLFGSETAIMAEAAVMVAEEFKPDAIDINMGCPTPKVVKNGDGSALLRNLDRAVAVARAVVSAVPLPVTVKMRTGWDAESVVAVELARGLEDAGVAALIVHGRTRAEFYAGRADWEIIRRVKESIHIPVIGNGDVTGADSAARFFEETGADAVAIGRGALGRPWVFREIAFYLEKGVRLPPPSAAEKVAVARRHLDLLIAQKGDEHAAVREMRKHVAWYLHGLRGAARLRQQANRAVSRTDLEKILLEAQNFSPEPTSPRAGDATLPARNL